VIAADADDADASSSATTTATAATIVDVFLLTTAIVAVSLRRV
jgi:hypothetical protein